MLRYGTVILSSLILCGCGVMNDPENPIHDRRDDYTQIKPGKPLQYPSGFKAPQAENDLPVPEVQGELMTVSLTPPGSLAERVNIDERGGKPMHAKLASQKIRIETQQGQLVMLLNEPIDETSDAIETALKKQKIKLLKADRKQHLYLVSDSQHRYVIHLAVIDKNNTRIELRDPSGKALNQDVAMTAFNQMSDGLKGNPNTSLYERLFG